MKTKELIQTYDEPYSNIECASTSKIPVRKMSTRDNFYESIDDGVRKANAAWGKVRNSFITSNYIGKTKDFIISIFNIRYIIKLTRNSNRKKRIYQNYEDLILDVYGLLLMGIITKTISL